MNQTYYDKCGRACIESFGQNWPNTIPLIVYNEDMVDPPRHRWVRYMAWANLPSQYDQFVERTEGHRVVQFAKKAFSIIHACEYVDCDRLIWLDADVVTTMAVNAQLLDIITPDHVLSTHYGVKHNWPSEDDPDRMSFSCETGFFILNKQHPNFQDFVFRYAEYYFQDLGYDLRRFYDGEVYGAVVAELEANGTSMLELNPGQLHKTPIPRSIMAPYIMHYKAGAKDPFNSTDLLEKHNLSNGISSDIS